MPFLATTKDYLNKKTDYLINWNRPGSLFFGTHRYSNRELLERGFVIASMALGGFLAANKSEKGGALPFAFGASLAFLLAHTVTMSPLIHKRLKAKWGCDELVKQLKAQTQSEEEFGSVVSTVIDQIMAHAAVKSPSAVWGTRLRLLNNLNEWIKNEDHNLLIPTLRNEHIISLLDNNTTLLHNNTFTN